MTSLVKVTVSEEDKQKVVDLADQVQSKINEFDCSKYTKIKRSVFTLFFANEVIDIVKLRTLNCKWTYAFSGYCIENKKAYLELTKSGESLMRLRSLSLSGEELYLTAEDCKTLNKVINESY